jgi:hypothetical protein
LPDPIFLPVPPTGESWENVAMRLLTPRTHNLLRAMMACGKTAGSENPSFKGTIDRLNHLLPVVLAADSAALRKRLVTDLVELIAEDQVPDRPFRREPRAVKRRPKPHQLLNKPRHQMTEISHRSRYQKAALKTISNTP